MWEGAFDRYFHYLAGYRPYPWQTRLFYEFVSGSIPQQIAIPTGLGKTSVMLVWLLALAEQARQRRVSLPRRLVYVVNRRTVVDQATAMAEGIRNRLAGDTPEAADLRRVLGSLSAYPEPVLAISTLRGQFADNRQWKEDPSRPSIVVGTVDMVGSKLLFAGYGDGRKQRPLHAGLLGHDALLVHDEAHLDPPFAALLQQLQALQQNHALHARPLKVLNLSATLREPASRVLTLSPEDLQHPAAAVRLSASKQLSVHEVDARGVFDRIATLAARFEGSAVRVLVFVRSPRDAQEQVAARLKRLVGKELQGRIAFLTGTMRGYERDRLLRWDPVFRAFMEHGPPSTTLYLIATSAGEVGVDLDADHLITELAPLDSLLQRLGRVNRRGGADRSAQVHVVVPETLDDKDPLAPSLAATKEILLRWQKDPSSCDLSPQNVTRLLADLSPAQRSAAFSPVPRLAPFTSIHADFLSATSLEQLPPGSPQVATLLHGSEPVEPEVTFFWRQELALLVDAPDPQIRSWFELCPPAQRELVRLPAWQFVRDFLGRLRRRGDGALAPARVVIFSGGRTEVTTLERLLQRDVNDLAFSLIALPTELGGLDGATGMADPAAASPVPDVAEITVDGQLERVRAVTELTTDAAWLTHRLDGEPWSPPASWELVGSVPLLTDAEGQVTKTLCLWAPRPETAAEEAEQVSGAVSLADHTAHVEAFCHRLAVALNLSPELAEALQLAARWHDEGKKREIWQYFAHAEKAPEPMAKGSRYRDPRVLGGFRHEWASLRLFWEHRNDDALAVRLARHLVASHHGWGRPHFPTDTSDPDASTRAQQDLAVAVANNFASLQNQLGWWTLAWVEALFRAADALASRLGAPPAGNP